MLFRTHMVFSLIIYFLAFLSKEGVITIIAVIPLTIYFFSDVSLKKNLIVSALFILPALVYLLLRQKIIGQIEKQIEVIKAYYHTNSQSIYLQSALFKVKSDLLFDKRQIQNIIKKSNSQIITVSRKFFVIEKSIGFMFVA